ncbi:MAG TPA: signal peptidase I [Pseudogracilibacillus sp.]|nr:signal peptidase I [Pseudogracilibacillus sp.]
MFQLAKQNNDSHVISEWIKAALIALVLALLLRAFVFATSVVKGESMLPTLEDGERVVFNKFIYLISEPARGDIVIIQKPESNYVKRIIGLPNETIEIRDNILYVDGVQQPSTFVGEREAKYTGDVGPITLPDDHYFVMGDNRANSKDSRNALGLIERKHIIGRSELIIYPFSEMQLTR